MTVEEPMPRSRRGPLAAAAGAVIAATATAIVIAAVRRARQHGTRLTMHMHIDRSVPDVFAFISDTRHDLQWLSNAVTRRKVTAGPIGVGTRFESTDRLGPRTIETTEEILEFEQDRRVKTRVSESWDGAYEVRVEPDDGGTLLSLDMNVHGNGLLGFLDMLPDVVMRRQYERDAGRLKELLERRQERLSTTDDDAAAEVAPAKRRVAVPIEPEADPISPVTEETEVG
jgi:uncharacterized protein YndB with AHSA1/START domain